MLDQALGASVKRRKGHAYSKIDQFRQLPPLTQAGLLAAILLTFFVLISIWPYHSSPAELSVSKDAAAEETTAIEVDATVTQFRGKPKKTQAIRTNDDDADADADADAGHGYGKKKAGRVSGSSDDNDGADAKTVRIEAGKLQALQAENAKLKSQVQTLMASVAAATAAGASASASGARAAGVPPSTGSQRSSKYGTAVGPFNWEAFSIEPNSTERRFWIKTATNEEGHHFYRRILIQNGWIETSNPKEEGCTFLFYGRFVPNLDQEFEMFEEGKHLINHIPGEFAVLNKEPFLHYMRNWSRDQDCDYTQMHPESYLIHLQQDCEDMFRLGDPTNALVRTGETEAQRDKSFWFWKPPFNSFGRGIKISTLKVIREEFGFGSALADAEDPEAAVRERCKVLSQNLTASNNKLLIQRAIHKPFLMKGTKFDFRAYILLANTKPWMVYFKFGHVRRCMKPFDLHSKVKKVHVCNDYSDELDDPNFPLSDHIWDYDKFRAHLLGLGYSAEDFDNTFIGNLKRLFLANFHTFKDAIPRKNGYWLMLGLDVAIGENWELYVLEVNTNPSVHYGTKTWGTAIVNRNWKQLNEVLELVYDTHLKTKQYDTRAWPPSDLVLRTKYGWELLYSDATNPPWQFVQDKCYVQHPLTKHPKKKKTVN